jgi:membrane fusion protein
VTADKTSAVQFAPDPPRCTTPKLFRHEAVVARRETWLGHVQLVQPVSTRIAIITTISFLAAWLVIAMTASYTRRAHTSGIITPSGGLMTITTPAAGMVSRAGIEGQKVSAGQVVYVIDRDANSVDGPTLQQVISALVAQRVALQHEYSMRQSIAKVQRQSLANEMANLAVQHDRLTQQLENTDKVLPVMHTAMDRLRVASSQHVVTDSQYQGQMFAFTELLGQHAQFQQTALAIEGRMTEITARIATFDDDLAKDLSQINRNISQLTQQIAEHQAKWEIKILAPIAGTLTAIRAYPGQTVAQGAPLVTLLPGDVSLEADLYVDSSSIGFIRQNAHVFLRYTAFPFQRFGLYEGQVTEITRAPMRPSDQTEPPQRTAETGRYRVVVAPRLPYVIDNDIHMPLQAGMEVDADIAIENRRLYQWLLDPLYRAAGSIQLVTASAKP